MGSFLNILGSAGLGFLTGGPVGAAAGGLSAAIGGSPSTAAGSAGNALLGGLLTGQNVFDTGELAQYMQFQNGLSSQALAFNEMMDQKAETMHEANTLREVAMQQRQADNEITKKFIEMIKG